MVTPKLICVFVFACAKSRFYHDTAHFRVITARLLVELYCLFICISPYADDQSSSHSTPAKPDSPQRQISEENWEEELAQESTSTFREKAASSRADRSSRENIMSSKESSVEKEV